MNTTETQSRRPHERMVRAQGYDALWLWFGLSRASWLTLPRVMMHEMPDEWQAKMAALLDQWDETWTQQPDLTTHVNIKQHGKYAKTPDYLVNYRHPDYNALNAMRPNAQAEPSGPAANS